MQNKTMMWIGIILGIIFVAIGVVYFTHAASALPHFFPGYDASMSAKHTKHGIAAVLLGVLCFVYAWFQSGPRKTQSTDQQN